MERCDSPDPPFGIVNLDDRALENTASAYANELRSNSEDASEAAVELAKRLRELDRPRDARKVVIAALALSGQTPELCDELGLVEAARKQWTAAVAAFESTDCTHPRAVDATVALTISLRELSRFADAERVIAAALEQCPNEPELLVQAGELAYEDHRYKESLGCFERALQTRKTYPAASSGRRNARLRLGIAWPMKQLCQAVDAATRSHVSKLELDMSSLEALRHSAPHRYHHLRATIRKTFWCHARIKAIEDVVLDPGTAYSFVLGLIGLAFAATLVIHPIHELSADSRVLAFLVYFNGGILLSAMLMIVAIGIAKLTEWTTSVSLPIFLGVTSGVSYLLTTVLLTRDRPHLPVFGGYVLVCGLWIGLAAILLLFVLVFLNALLVDLAHKTVRRHYPLATAIASLAMVLDGDNLREAPGAALISLEQAARGISVHLRRLQPTGDGRTDRWLVERANGIAAGVRELKPCLIARGNETEQELVQRVEHDLLATAAGHWLELTWVDPGPALARKRRKAAASVARGVAIAALPFIALLVVESTGVISLGSTETNQFVLVSTLWAVVSLLTPLDPNLSEKLSVAKESVSMLRPGGDR